MFNFGGGGDLFSKEELDDLLDSGDGVVSRDDPPYVVEAADDIDTFPAPEKAPPAVNDDDERTFQKSLLGLNTTLSLWM